jgi:hypothetical protein
VASSSEPDVAGERVEAAIGLILAGLKAQLASGARPA